MKKACRISRTHQLVYRFRYPFQRAFSLCLLTTLLSLPLAPVFASGDAYSEDGALSEEVLATEDVADISLEESRVSNEAINESESEVSEETTVESEDATPLVIEDSNPSVSPIPESVEVQDATTSSTDDGVMKDVGDVDPVEVLPDVATSTDDAFGSRAEDGIAHEDAESESGVTETHVSEVDTNVDAPPIHESNEALDATTTEQELAPEHVVNAVTNDENRFSFSKNECTATGDGAFYCSRKSDAPTVVHADRVFSAVDVDGDKEIYMEKDGELSAITENQFDDDAPYFDEHSNTIVWHRLIDGRYQIISFDIDTEEEMQITNERYNNMEPQRHGDTIVWQAWIGNDWDIVMWKDGAVRTVTDNEVHDVMPHVNGSHTIWQSFEDNVWKMKVLDARSEVVETIGGTGGGSVENPRVVLVYDTKFESGDVETRGYNLETGEVVELGATPAPVPEEIPDPDQTGEERALVSASPQPKIKIDGEEDDILDPPPDGTHIDVLGGDLVVAPLATSTATDTIEAVVDIDVTEPIVDIEVPTATTSVDHIDDLVIPPYVEPVTEESTGDAQISIAQEL